MKGYDPGWAWPNRQPFKRGTRSQRACPAVFEEVSCYDVKAPVRGPNGKEMWGPLDAK